MDAFSHLVGRMAMSEYGLWKPEICTYSEGIIEKSHVSISIQTARNLFRAEMTTLYQFGMSGKDCVSRNSTDMQNRFTVLLSIIPVN